MTLASVVERSGLEPLGSTVVEAEEVASAELLVTGLAPIVHHDGLLRRRQQAVVASHANQGRSPLLSTRDGPERVSGLQGPLVRGKDIANGPTHHVAEIGPYVDRVTAQDVDAIAIEDAILADRELTTDDHVPRPRLVIAATEHEGGDDLRVRVGLEAEHPNEALARRIEAVLCRLHNETRTLVEGLKERNHGMERKRLPCRGMNGGRDSGQLVEADRGSEDLVCHVSGFLVWVSGSLTYPQYHPVRGALSR